MLKFYARNLLMKLTRNIKGRESERETLEVCTENEISCFSLHKNKNKFMSLENTRIFMDL